MFIQDPENGIDHPIHEIVARRWSPDSFDERSVESDVLQSLFEASRWSASSYNEQPWSYIIATKDESEEYNRMLSCLSDENQNWAKSAPFLALAIVKRNLSRNGKENKAAVHDLGLASANLVFEATARGLMVHQMIGILPEKAKELYRVPDGFEVWTALAIGYPSKDSAANPGKVRKRKKLSEFIFTKTFGNSASFTF
jgi:nitroreductase